MLLIILLLLLASMQCTVAARRTTHIIHFDTDSPPFLFDAKNFSAASGAMLLNASAVQASLSAAELRQWRAAGGARVSALAPHMKYHPELLMAVRAAGDGVADIRFAISVVPASDAAAAAATGGVGGSGDEVLSLLRLSGFHHSATASRSKVSSSSTILGVTVPASHGPALLEALSRLQSVLWVEEVPAYRTWNRWAAALCSAGASRAHGAAAATEYAATGGSNLTGHGVVVGIADTGLDANSCFFNDPDVSMRYNQVNKEHRKIVYYNSQFGDTADAEQGHGTHVAGSAAGMSTTNGFSNYNGIAHGAKIAFFDLQKGSAGGLNVPADMAAIFDPLYEAGARVFSNSWGNPSIGGYANSYTLAARYVDLFMYYHPDSLIVFAAGNSGAFGDHSVSSPATNKNGVCVGASLSGRAGFESVRGSTPSQFSENGVAYFSSRGPTLDLRLKPDVLAPGMIRPYM
jgi:subtilisin family serine protease